MKSFIKWLKPSFESVDGKTSHRKLSVFFFCLVYLYMIIMTAYGSIFPDIAWISTASGAGLMSALKTFQNIKYNETK